MSIKDFLGGGLTALSLSLALGLAYYSSTPQVLHGAGAYILGGNNECDDGTNYGGCNLNGGQIYQICDKDAGWCESWGYGDLEYCAKNSDNCDSKCNIDSWYCELQE